MTAFPAPLSAPQKATARASGYWSRVFTCLNPNTVVFRARASQSITTRPFIEFTYDSVEVGAYTDVWEGMVVYISATTDRRQAKYRGRVRAAPDTENFYIDFNGTVLETGDYIIVTRDGDLFERHRGDTLIDDGIAYHGLPPMLKDLPGCVVLYDADADGSVTWTPDQSGLPVDAAATVVDTWAWDVSGDGTSSLDDDSAEHPVFTFEAGYHYLVRVRYTDDQPVTNYQLVHIYAVTRTLDAPVVQAVVAGTVDCDDGGWTASLTAYADVGGLLDRTHCAVWHIEHFGDHASTPFVSNLLMNGRIRSSSLSTEGSAEAGVVQQVSFTVEGLAAYLQRLRIPRDIVRAVASPNEWGEMVDPTPYRAAVYMMWAYSTLTNICALSVEDGAFADFLIGDEPRGIEGRDVLQGFLWDTVKAAPNWSPSGEIRLAQDTSYRTDRSGVEVITAFTEEDLIKSDIDLDSSRTVSQVIAFGGSFDSTVEAFVIYTALAPSVVFGDGGETRELTRELLPTDLTVTEARTALGLRASNHFAHENPKPLAQGTLFDSYAGLLIPTNFQRWAFVLLATSNGLNRAWTATDYWQLQSISLTINPDGTLQPSGEWPAETTFDDAQIEASLLPDNISDSNPVFPSLPNDFGFPTDPLEGYPTDTPALDELSPLDPFSGLGAYAPVPPNVAADAAAKTGKPQGMTVQVNFRSSTNASSSPRVSVLGAPYRLRISGTSLYSSDEWQYVFNFLAEDGGFVRNPDPTTGNNQYGTWSAAGWGTDDAFASSNYRRGIDIVLTGIASTTFTYFQAKFEYNGIPFVPPGSPAFVAQIGSNILWVVNDTAMPSGPNLYQAWTGSLTDTSLRISLNASVNDTSAVYGGSARLKELVVRGTGTNPFDGSVPAVRETDAFYVYDPNDPDALPSLLGSDEGLFLDNTRYSPVPDYDKSHVYDNLPFTGTNNPLLARMVFNTYSTKSNRFLTVEGRRTL